MLVLNCAVAAHAHWQGRYDDGPRDGLDLREVCAGYNVTLLCWRMLFRSRVSHPWDTPLPCKLQRRVSLRYGMKGYFMTPHHVCHTEIDVPTFQYTRASFECNKYVGFSRPVVSRKIIQLLMPKYMYGVGHVPARTCPFLSPMRPNDMHCESVPEA